MKKLAMALTSAMMLFGSVTAFAEPEGTAPNQQQAGPMELIISLLPMLILIVVFYFILIRPQRKRDKETKAMLESLKVGDKIVTIGGICGKIVKIKDTFVFVETGNIGTEAEKCVIKMERDSVKSVEKKVTN